MCQLPKKAQVCTHFELLSAEFRQLQRRNHADGGHDRRRGLVDLAGACPVRAVADEEARGEDLQQEGGQREIWLVRGESRDRAGRGCQGVRKLIWSGGMPAASTAIPTMAQIAW